MRTDFVFPNAGVIDPLSGAEREVNQIVPILFLYFMYLLSSILQARATVTIHS